jgi:23S rRNA pseudouridine1911/1915/1917 synthase
MDDNLTITLVVSEEDEGQRLDRYCASQLDDFSRNQVQSINEQGGITVDARARPHSYSVRAGEKVIVDTSLLQPPGFERGMPVAQNIPVPVVYEDDAIIVVNKPAGMVTHPAHGNWDGTLVNALLGGGTKLASLGSPERPGVVHRLDKDTSGLMVLAKTDPAFRGLADAFKAQTVTKIYHAIVWGTLPRREMMLDAAIGRHPVQRQKMAVVEGGGKPARSALFVVDSYIDFDYIRVTIFTGRTHQIRVHLSHLGHPLLGDSVYGGRKRQARVSSMGSKGIFENLLEDLPRQALHASRLSFEHPVSGERMTFQAALPADMRLALEMIHGIYASRLSGSVVNFPLEDRTHPLEQ